MLTPDTLVGPLFGHGGFTWLVLINYPFGNSLDGHVNHLETENMNRFHNVQGRIDALAEARCNLRGEDPNDETIWQRALVEARQEMEEGDNGCRYAIAKCTCRKVES